MIYRLNKDTLLDILSSWTPFIKRKVRMVACGGTALTLMGLKDSTKDVDFMIPNEKEYEYLIKILKDLGYKPAGQGWVKKNDAFIFDLFKGNRVHTTELIDSPLDEGNHTFYKELSNIWIGILNDYDLIASKLFRGTGVDIDDCMVLVNHHKGMLDISKVVEHAKELARYDISVDKIININIQRFIDELKEAGLYE